MIRPQFRVSVASVCLPLPALIIARSHVGVAAVSLGGTVDASASRMSSLHSASVRILSMTAAKELA